MKYKVGIVMGSDSDLPVIEKATNTLSALGIEFEVHVYSAHRTPDEAAQYAMTAQERGIGVLIAAAGMAAHLAGAIAARTTLPVIGIPCKSSNLGGIEALLSTVQMPGGIPVATVAIDGGVNAALLAAQILALSDEELDARLKAHRQAQYEGVLAKDKAIAEKFCVKEKGLYKNSINDGRFSQLGNAYAVLIGLGDSELLEKIIIREFIEKFSALYGKKANVQIRHLFYGNQKLNRCVLHPFAD